MQQDVHRCIEKKDDRDPHHHDGDSGDGAERRYQERAVVAASVGDGGDSQKYTSQSAQNAYMAAELVDDDHESEKEHDLIAKIEDLEMTIQQVTGVIDVLKAEIVEMQMQSRRAGEDREKENKEFQIPVVDQREMKKLLQVKQIEIKPEAPMRRRWRELETEACMSQACKIVRVEKVVLPLATGALSGVGLGDKAQALGQGWQRQDRRGVLVEQFAHQGAPDHRPALQAEKLNETMAEPKFVKTTAELEEDEVKASSLTRPFGQMSLVKTCAQKEDGGEVDLLEFNMKPPSRAGSVVSSRVLFGASAGRSGTASSARTSKRRTPGVLGLWSGFERGMRRRRGEGCCWACGGRHHRARVCPWRNRAEINAVSVEPLSQSRKSSPCVNAGSQVEMPACVGLCDDLVHVLRTKFNHIGALRFYDAAKLRVMLQEALDEVREALVKITRGRVDWIYDKKAEAVQCVYLADA
mmetsp:Transcript_129479/g.326956  ORF Transcript_129479/g.326956 Transcript_129479/m.326956 type:complete len:467 (+) Transcript_129479:94-1494(+)